MVGFAAGGGTVQAAISRDGRYVAYVSRESNTQSLWLRQVGPEKDLQIVPPARTKYIGATFSNDSDYLYYVVYEGGSGIGALYRIAAIGGGAKRILENLDSPITFSPDGRQFAFVRCESPGRTRLLPTPVA